MWIFAFLDQQTNAFLVGVSTGHLGIPLDPITQVIWADWTPELESDRNQVLEGGLAPEF
jgi:hypothetical protein